MKNSTATFTVTFAKILTSYIITQAALIFGGVAIRILIENNYPIFDTDNQYNGYILCLYISIVFAMMLTTAIFSMVMGLRKNTN